MLNVPRAMRTERSPVRFATPYLEVETRSVSSMERAIRRELAQASHTANRNKRKGGDQPLVHPNQAVLPTTIITTPAILARDFKRKREAREKDQFRRDELDLPARRAGAGRRVRFALGGKLRADMSPVQRRG
jgi:hypothetical protein